MYRTKSKIIEKKNIKYKTKVNSVLDKYYIKY